MPTPDEIVKAFKETATKETWTKDKNNPTALADAERELRDLLNDPDPNSYSKKAFDFMEKYKDGPSVGVATSQALFTKGDQGKAVATDVAKQVMSAELGRFNPTQGFLRSQHAINGLTKQFIQDTSPDCDRQIREKVSAMKQRYPDLDQVAAGNDMQAKTEITSRLGKDMLSIMSTTPLTQESMAFLKGMRETIEGDQNYIAKYQKAFPGKGVQEAEAGRREIADIVVNNNAALRFASPIIRTDPMGQNDLWKEASGASLSTFSGARKDAIKPKVKTGDNQVDDQNRPRALTPQEVAENKFLADISKNIHAERGMVLDFQDQISNGRPSDNLAVQKFQEKAELEKSLKPEIAKVDAMEKRMADLKKPISIEKIKAFFSRKGVEGTKADLREQIDDAKESIDKSRTKLDQRFEKLKADQVHDHNKEALLKKTGLDPDKLETALEIPAVKKAMMDFAKKEFSTENLEFHEAVGELNKMVESGASVAELRDKAENIRKTFIADDAPKQINVRHDVRKGVDEALHNLGQSQPTEQDFHTWGPQTRQQYGEAFKGTDHAVMELTKMDTFARFKLDSTYKEAVKKSLDPDGNGSGKPSVRESMGLDKRQSQKVEGPKKTVGVGV